MSVLDRLVPQPALVEIDRGARLRLMPPARGRPFARWISRNQRSRESSSASERFPID